MLSVFSLTFFLLFIRILYSLLALYYQTILNFLMFVCIVFLCFETQERLEAQHQSASNGDR